MCNESIKVEDFNMQAIKQPVLYYSYIIIAMINVVYNGLNYFNYLKFILLLLYLTHFDKIFV